MCLYNIRSNNKRLLNTPDRNGLLSGYKLFYKMWRVTVSPYSNYMWQEGWNYSNRKFNKVTIKEHSYNEIHLGFHIFINKKAALVERNKLSKLDSSDIKKYHKYFVRKVWFKPDDLVAVGEYCGKRAAVVTKLYVRFD